MYVIGTCKKCGNVSVFDIGNRNTEEGKELMKKSRMGECPGMHVEIGTWADYYSFDWNNLYDTEIKAVEAKDAQLNKNIQREVV